MKLILASSSPQRKRILEDLGVRFSVISPDIDEHHGNLTSPHAIAKDLAYRKAIKVAKDHPDHHVLAADTIVVQPGNRILGKPEKLSEAKEVLLRYSNSYCDVYTGVAFVHLKSRKKIVIYDKTRLYFNEITESEAGKLLKSGSWKYSSGSIKIEEIEPFLKKREGDYWNVVGLPKPLIAKWFMPQST